MGSPTARDAAEGLAEQIKRLRAASEVASAGEAFTCGPPWFTYNYGVLAGSPDPHAGTLIADTDTTAFEGSDRDDVDRDANATFITEAWNFARLILGRPDLLAALRSAGTEGGETQGAGPWRPELMGSDRLARNRNGDVTINVPTALCWLQFQPECSTGTDEQTRPGVGFTLVAYPGSRGEWPNGVIPRNEAFKLYRMLGSFFDKHSPDAPAVLNRVGGGGESGKDLTVRNAEPEEG